MIFNSLELVGGGIELSMYWLGKPCMMMSPTKKGNIGTDVGKDSEFSVTDNVSNTK